MFTKGRLRELGILVDPSAATCTHLAAPRILRTEKFVCALAHAPVILSTQYVDDCLSNGRYLSPNDYLLEDTEYEKQMGYTLSEALVRAKENKGRLLQGYCIYATDAVYGGFDTYKSIIEANGGSCLLYRGRASTNVPSRAADDDDSDDSRSSQLDFIYLVSGTTQEEAKLWPKFRQMVEAKGKSPRIVRNDWLLNLALSQQHAWKALYALSEKDVGL